MNSPRVAIIDNSILANFMDSGLWEVLEKTRVVFNTFFIPIEVRNEFLNVPARFLSNRSRFIGSLNTNSGFFQLCDTFDAITSGILQTRSGVDAGEAELIAQAVKRHVYILLLDDKRCKGFIEQEYSHYRCYGSLFLIALLDLNHFLPESRAVLKQLHPTFKFRSKDLATAYNQAAQFLQIPPLSKKEMALKRSMKGISG